MYLALVGILIWPEPGTALSLAKDERPELHAPLLQSSRTHLHAKRTRTLKRLGYTLTIVVHVHFLLTMSFIRDLRCTDVKICENNDELGLGTIPTS